MNYESPPLISIIVAVFNGADTLQLCIDSVVKQSYPNLELIIIDGGSSDGTVDLLNANKEQIAYWISESDHGIYHAWNKGLAQAKGEWICFLGADDFFYDERVLEKVVTQLVALPSEIRVAYGKIMLINTDSGNTRLIGMPWEKIRKRFRDVMCIPHPGVMHRRSLFDDVGVFNESYQIAGDYELLMRELKSREAYFIQNVVTVGMLQGGVSSKPENGLLIMLEIRRAQKLHGQRLPGWIWLITTARVYLRLMFWSVFGGMWAGKILALCRRKHGSSSS